MITYNLRINNVDYTEYMPYCFSDKEALDESLDLSHIQLIGSPLNEPIKPFSKVVLTLNDGETTETITRVVAIDKTTEIIGHNFTNHDLLLIEETKITERMFLGGKTTTQPLTHLYLQDPQPCYCNAIWEATHTNYDKYIQYFKSPQEYNTNISYNLLKIAQDVFGTLATTLHDGTCDCTIEAPDGTQETFRETYNNLSGEGITKTFTPTQIGQYKFTLVYKFYAISVYRYDANVDFVLYSINAETMPDDKTIKDVVDEILETVECLEVGEEQQYTFGGDQYGEIDKYADIKAPEFTFAKMSLWEALSQVASYVQAIPYLDGDQVKFYKIDNSNEVSSMMLPYVSNTQSHDMEQFCSSLDSNIDNMLNSENINAEQITTKDTIKEPYETGYQTVRTESGVAIIDEENMFIETKYPIGRVVSLECGYLSDGTTLVGDITPYVYESAEYNALDSFSEVFPLSKSFAIKYTYGQRNITGLGFKVPNAVSDIFSNRAIVNIIVRKTNKPYGVIQQLFDSIKPMNLMFRVNYIPIIDTRVKTSKNYTDEQNNYSIAYNQNANVVDSKAIGENLKGVIARFGNVDKNVTYIIPKLNQVPKIGDKFDNNYWVSTISKEYYRNFIICELGLSKNFNRYSSYVGISNNLRLYEVSEKQALDRYIIREDFCVISDERYTVDDNNKSWKANYVSLFPNSAVINKISSCKTTTYDEMGNVLNGTSYYLPTIALGIGNSTVLSVKYEDNYTAGNVAKTGSFSVQGGTQYAKSQTYAPYGDAWGRAKYLDVGFFAIPVNNSAIDTYNKKLAVADKLPIIDSEYQGGIVKIANHNHIILNKDNRETIHFTYQMHFITDNTSYVVGSGLGKFNSMSSNPKYDGQLKLWILDKELDTLSSIIDTTNAVLQDSSLYSQSVNDAEYITPASTKWVANGKSWAITVEDENGLNMLIYGKNGAIIENEDIQMPYLNFMHKIKEN